MTAQVMCVASAVRMAIIDKRISYCKVSQKGKLEKAHTKDV